MGNNVSVTAPTAGATGIDVPELSDLVYERALGSARFMKTVRARHHDGVVLVKVFVKSDPRMSLDDRKQQIIRELFMVSLLSL